MQAQPSWAPKLSFRNNCSRRAAEAIRAIAEIAQIKFFIMNCVSAAKAKCSFCLPAMLYRLALSKLRQFTSAQRAHKIATWRGLLWVPTALQVEACRPAASTMNACFALQSFSAQCAKFCWDPTMNPASVLPLISLNGQEEQVWVINRNIGCITIRKFDV